MIIYIGTLLCTAALSTTRTDLGPGNGFIVGKILNSRAFIKLSALLISRIFTELVPLIDYSLDCPSE